MQETANKQKRMTLKTLHEMLNGMSVELAEKVHLLYARGTGQWHKLIKQL